MRDDITFCGSECNAKNCFRHPSNIKHSSMLHSFADFKGTDDCLNEILKGEEHDL